MVCRWCAGDGVLGVHGESIVLLREYGVADERGRFRASGGIALSPMPVIAAEFPASSWQSGLERKSRCKGATGYPRSHELATLHVMDERRRIQTPYS